MILKWDLNKKNTLIEKESWHRDARVKESIDMELEIIGYSVYFPKTELKKTRKGFPIVRLHSNHKANFYVKGQ